ncbi:hypothetical protein F3Y22_tig00109926pilonHSYRG00145 [Hibiscus syriacus]|uniref:Uncharacterized protein n=1 Tax=Hibiscus syriacus TaxID=106335 RepID=A0A6A3BTB9_HIBSY|nr:hypothetical protein F3Y22_tig00109926pilonHSYRG00145 [Hibiscus syriacus]
MGGRKWMKIDDKSGGHDDKETINLASTSAVGDFMMDGDCHLAESDWVSDGFADGMWSMGELWELRNFH